MDSRYTTKSNLRWLYLIAIVISAAFATVMNGSVRAADGRTAAKSAQQALALDAGRTREFMSYNESLSLNPEQRKVFLDALSPIPAPCCSKNSMATCCCPCNLAKSVWGLSKYLIVKRNYTSSQVRKSASEWLHVTNPQGYSGDACPTGHCNRSFAENGCGGMNAEKLIGVP